MDFIDGRRVPPLVISSDHDLHGTHVGTVEVKAGHLRIHGTVEGSLRLHPGVEATILGKQQGSVSVGSRAVVRIVGAVEGSTSLDVGATIIVESGAKLAGSLLNNGRVIVRGVFGGPTLGSGHVLVEGAGEIKQPRIVDGVHYYDW